MKTCPTLFGVLLLALAGCSAPVPSSDPYLGAVPPPVEGRIPTDYVLIGTAVKERPEWIDREPDDGQGLHFLVGVSKNHATEQEAREEAMRDARKKFAEFTGVEVSHFDEMVRSLYGSASGVLDAEVSEVSRTSQTTDARVSRIKARQWYWERYRAEKRGVSQGAVYRYWVLVSVPLDEYDRVQQWLQARKDEEQREKRQMLAQAEEEVRKILAETGSRRGQAEKAFLAGELIPALTILQAEWHRLDRLQAAFTEKGDLFAGKTGELKTMQRTLALRVGEMCNAVFLDTGRFASICISPHCRETAIPLWAWIKAGAGYRPAVRLPLSLTDSSGTIVSRAVTNSSGQAEFPFAASPPLSMRLGIDSEAADLQSLAGPIHAALVRVEIPLTVSVTAADPAGAARTAVQELFRGPSQGPLTVRRLLIGPVTEGESRQGGDFALLLKQHLIENLTRLPGVEIVESRPRDIETVAEALRLRGITAIGDSPALGSAATQAVIDGADAALETSFSAIGREIGLHFRLREAGTGVLLAAASATVLRETVPAGILPPTAIAPVPAQITPVKGQGIRLEVASHLGDGETYREGETISYFVNTDRDAYLLLIYEDAEGNLIRILPNRHSGQGFYRADSTIRIPGAQDRFEFTITGPFGTERVWAFASSVPFPVLPGQELDNGLLLCDSDLPSLLQRIRAVGKRSGNLYGEAQTIITTVRQKQMAARH